MSAPFASGALEPLVADHRVALCVGHGGSGKTTFAATLGLAAARAGRRVVVVTIDPARRLGDALGVDALADEPRPVRTAAGAGLDLDAMILEPRRGWDRLIARHADGEAAAARVLDNRFYQRMSRGFAGSYEILAIEQLGALVERNRYDLIVVDTPPAAHALDFFDAPSRVLDLFERRLLRWLLLPYSSVATRQPSLALARSVRRLLSQLERAVGATTLTEIADFIGAISLLVEPIRGRAEMVYRTLRRRDSARVLVCESSERGLREAERFAAELARHGVPPTWAVLNRASPAMCRAVIDGDDIAAELAALPPADVDLARALIDAGLPSSAPASWIGQVYRQGLAAGAVEFAAAERFSAGAPRGLRMAVAPALDYEPCSLDRLDALADAIARIDRAGWPVA